jgi:hypothetical protein
MTIRPTGQYRIHNPGFRLLASGLDSAGVVAMSLAVIMMLVGIIFSCGVLIVLMPAASRNYVVIDLVYLDWSILVLKYLS